MEATSMGLKQSLQKKKRTTHDLTKALQVGSVRVDRKPDPARVARNKARKERIKQAMGSNDADLAASLSADEDERISEPEEEQPEAEEFVAVVKHKPVPPTPEKMHYVMAERREVAAQKKKIASMKKRYIPRSNLPMIASSSRLHRKRGLLRQPATRGLQRREKIRASFIRQYETNRSLQEKRRHK